MTAISQGIGSGAVNEMTIGDAIKESWCDFMTVDIKLACSPEFTDDSFQWKCSQGINDQTMTMLNEEFNFFRGLFPLKVFITGPPCSGKTHFGTKLNEMYGVPHFCIKDIINMGLALQGGYGDVVRQRIEELKDQAEADYEKTRKKKDPDFDRASFNPRLPDDVLHELVKIQLNSAGCMNKGFILEGFPRSMVDSKEVFCNKTPKENQPSGDEEAEIEYDYHLNSKIVPQYCIVLNADDAFLT